jgi:hypothetical protein
MKLKKINSLIELAELLTPLELMYHQSLDLTTEDNTFDGFVSRLLASFKDCAYFAEVDDAGLIYFIALEHLNESTCGCWILYVAKAHRIHTKTILETAFQEVKTAGYKSVKFITNNTKLSFERWVRKLGGRKTRITFQIDL